MLFQWYVFEGGKKPYVKSSLGIDFGFLNQKIVTDGIFIDVNEWAKLEKVLSSRIEKDPDYYQKFINLCYKCADRLIGESEKIGRMQGLQNISDQELLKLYKDYQISVLKSIPFLDTTLVLNNILTKSLTGLLESELGIKDKNEQDLLLSNLVIPIKKSFFVEETEAILRIALKMQKKRNADIGKDIDKYLEKFAWMSMIAYVGKPYTKEAVLKRVEEILKEDPKEQMAKAREVNIKTVRNYEIAYQKIEKSQKLVNLINYAQEFLYLLNYRLDIFFKAHFLVSPLFKEIGRRMNITVDEVVYLTGDEIVELIEGKKKIDKKEVVQRVSDYALIKKEGKFYIQSGKDVKRVAYGKVVTTEVKGQVANRGRATGKIKLVFETEDISKVMRGDILVSPMTRPNMVPAMMKARGIITDFGGMLCHAAIISREFDLPCVVGTKNATKVFKDGDLVELNVYEGIARKLK